MATEPVETARGADHRRLRRHRRSLCLRACAHDGYRLVLVARSNEELNRVAGVIATKLDVETVAIPRDLAKPNAADELDAELSRRRLSPDILVNNAGYGLRGEATELSVSEQLEMIDLNIRTLTELSLRCGTSMKQRGGGGIINVSSTASLTCPARNMAVYYATKAFVSSFTEALSVELKPFGVQVTAVSRARPRRISSAAPIWRTRS